MKNKIVTPKEISDKYLTMDKAMEVLKTKKQNKILNLISKGNISGMKVAGDYWISVDSLVKYLSRCEEDACITN